MIDCLQLPDSASMLDADGNGHALSSEHVGMSGFNDPCSMEPNPVISPSWLPLHNQVVPSDYAGETDEDKHNHQVDSVLIEYFAGWTIANVEKYRRFVVVTTRIYRSEQKKWGHVSEVKSLIESPSPVSNCLAISQLREIRARTVAGITSSDLRPRVWYR